MPSNRPEPAGFRLTLEGRRCELRFGRGVLGLAPAAGGSAVAVVDRGAWRAHAGPLRRALRDEEGRPWPLRVVPGGEGAKSVENLARLWAWFADRGLPRDGVVVGVGGGAVLDLAGLAAATWQRGVRFVAIPTTLLAMVDAAIGGKTAIDVGGRKNNVGAFHPAIRVLADPAFLATLPRREWRCGLAETIKAAVIGSPGLFASLERESAALSRAFAGPRRGRADLAPPAARRLPWAEWIGAAAAVKAGIVRRDFREAGPRRALNLGHTLGHALEADGSLTHGEAVAVGMATVVAVARARGLCPARDAARILDLLAACGLPRHAPLPAAARLDRLLAADKKRLGGRIRWVLPLGVGAVAIDGRVSRQELRAAARALAGA